MGLFLSYFISSKTTLLFAGQCESDYILSPDANFSQKYVICTLLSPTSCESKLSVTCAQPNTLDLSAATSSTPLLRLPITRQQHPTPRNNLSTTPCSLLTLLTSEQLSWTTSTRPIRCPYSAVVDLTCQMLLRRERFCSTETRPASTDTFLNNLSRYSCYTRLMVISLYGCIFIWLYLSMVISLYGIN